MNVLADGINAEKRGGFHFNFLLLPISRPLVVRVCDIVFPGPNPGDGRGLFRESTRISAPALAEVLVRAWLRHGGM